MAATSESRGLAAQCWCDKRTENTTMDPVLAEVFAEQLDRVTEDAKQFCRNADFYHGIVTKIGEMFGDAAKTSDDGSIQDDVLALKVPELVAEMVARMTKGD